MEPHRPFQALLQLIPVAGAVLPQQPQEQAEPVAVEMGIKQRLLSLLEQTELSTPEAVGVGVELQAEEIHQAALAS